MFPLTGNAILNSSIGTGFGCDDGQTPLTGYAMCDLWSAESRSRPFQQLGAWNRTFSCVPAGQFAGKSQLKKLSPHSQPSTCPGWLRNSSSVELGLPTTYRRPGGNGRTSWYRMMPDL